MRKLPLGLMPLGEFMARRDLGLDGPRCRETRENTLSLPVEHPRDRAPHGKRGASPTPRMLADMAWRAHDPCPYCGGKSEHWDHMESRHRGGYNEPDNLIRACARCNMNKRTRSPLIYLALRAAGLRS